ncbi:DEKNAAC102665 [Brettanomyces naardenensis]|uniref:Mitochondrial distribution and morphology protein 34 n=1 Tax=Brettanomyces naardenensis TaxID=13370 RepID=A0A448YKZ3_BRENA|nr:DEKNAAC102665 [Brettanomyces naardenensis]
MSFNINWNCIEKDSFTQYAKDALNDAMNSGKKPNILSDDIRIVDLNFGSIPPDFEILEIGDLGSDRFRGIFKFNYFGDAFVTLTTKVSASLLKNYNANITDDLVDNSDGSLESNCRDLAGFITPRFIVSDCDFDIPLNLTLGSIKMSSIIVVVFSVTKGLTLVFKNDPLESIEVSSTFDKIKPIARFLQEKIETQIGELFREFLPSMLYKFSLEYTSQSFDQFHRSMNEEQEEEEPRVMLKDIDPDAPMGMSPGSLMRLTRLASSRQTLALGGELSCDRMNNNIVTKAFANAILASSNSFAYSKLHMTAADFLTGAVGDRVSVIKDFQARTFWKGSHGDEGPPRRRVIKLHSHKKTKKQQQQQQPESETVPEAVAEHQAVEIKIPDEEVIAEEDDATLVGSESSSTGVKSRTVSMTEKKHRALSSNYGSSLGSSETLNEDQDFISVPMSRRISRGSNASTATMLPSRGMSRNVSTSHQTNDKPRQSSQTLHERPSAKQLQQLQRQLQEQWISLPAKLADDIRSRTQNVYHIGKDEQLKIKKRIVKLDQLLNRKNAEKYDMEKVIPKASAAAGYKSRPGFDSPPPPYSYF